MKFTSTEKIIVATFALVCFALHFFVNLSGAYGFFRDELYYIACSDHLAWGYVDQPPFSLFLLKLSRLIFGDSLAAIRLIPALTHSLTIVLAAMIVKEMNGKALAVFIACLTIMVSIIHLGMSAIYSMNSIDILIWAFSFYLILRIINTQENRLWIWLGIVLGIGLLNKISILFLGSGIFVGFLLMDRKWFATRWPYIAGLLAFVIFLPYIIWNLNHDLAHLEFIHNASAGKYSGRTRFDFIKEQLLYLNPLSAPIWLTGIVVLFFYKPLEKFRLLGWIFLTAFIILIVNRTSKGEYLSPAYIILFAAAGVFIEQVFTKPALKWITYSYLFILFICSILLLPVVLPILPVEEYIRYSEAIGNKPSSSENKELSELPQFYADMFGWKEKVRDVAKVYNSLSDEDKARCTIFSNNYGRNGALDFFGKEYGLPETIGNHNNYVIWGPGNHTGDVMIILGGSMEDHKNDFESITLAGVSDCKYCMPYENHVNIFICRGLKYKLTDIWKEIKHYE
jgi:hypothetical protein